MSQHREMILMYHQVEDYIFLNLGEFILSVKLRMLKLILMYHLGGVLMRYVMFCESVFYTIGEVVQ